MNVLTDYRQEELQEEETIDLGHYWRVLMRFKWLIILLSLATTGFATYTMKNADDIYESTASLQIVTSRSAITSIEDLYGGEGGQSQQYYSTQFEMLKNRNLAERVILELNLIEHAEFLPEPDDGSFSLGGFISGLMPAQQTTTTTSPEDEYQILLSSVIEIFGDRLTITPISNTDLVNVSFEAKDPVLAATVANALAQGFIENDIEQRLSATQQASEWLTERLQGLRDVLNISEENLQAFMERESLVNIGGVNSLNFQELDQLTSQSVNDRLTRAEAESIYNVIQSLDNPTTEELMAYPAILNHSSIQGVRTIAENIDRQISELSLRYGRNHPTMRALAAERQGAQTNLSRQVQQVVASLERDYRSAINNENNTLAQLEQSKTDLQGVNRMSFQLRELEREVETNQQLYDIFYTRVRETDETNSFQTTNAIIVDPAVASVFPSGPNRKLVVIAALVFGGIIGVFLAFLSDFMDNTLKNHTDIEERLNITALGVVPLVKQSRAEVKAGLAYLGTIDDMQSKFSESLRTIRTSIALSSLNKPYKVIVVTSTVPNEGKSTLSINLASIMGQMGKTLLIDTDMRKPSLAVSLGMERTDFGLSDLLTGNAKLKDCVHKYKRASMYILPAGKVQPNPLELLSSPKFKKLLAHLSKTFDTIILDTPPMRAVSDSLVLATMADAVVYVIKADATPVSTVKTELERLRRSNANVVGAVLNQIDTSKNSAAEYGGYYDAYGYSAGGEA